VESRNITVNDLPAIYLLADQQPQQQGQPALRTLSYIIQYNGNIYHLIGVSTVADHNNYNASFNNTMRAFRPLTDPVKLNKKPQRIRIRTVGSSIALSQFLAQHNVPGARLEEHAILNGMQLTDNLVQGTLIKIIAE
jgi:predicted Zn-dependent protease